MEMIKNVRVTSFKSIRDSVLSDLRNFNSIAGLNNAGKSNFLRAINAFFTGEIEPGVQIDVDRDYYRPDLNAKKKKEITVSIEFSLPAHFKYRKGLENSESLLGREFTITKKWSREFYEPEYFLNYSQDRLELVDQDKVDNFLNLISFRYIPNRVIPTEVIRAEHQPLRDVIIRRLGRYREESRHIFDGLRAAADNLTGTIASQTSKIAPDIGSIRLATARSLEELAFKFGYELSESGVSVSDEEQGSGMQSLLMFQTLHLIDLDTYQKFGWRQASIWLVEEPESSLHTALEAQVAKLLSTISSGEKSRLQIISTTHSDLVIQYSDATYLAEKCLVSSATEKLQTVATQTEKRNLLKKMASYGISRFSNPILVNPLDPLFLVEGKYDMEFISNASKYLSDREWKVYCLESMLDNGKTGGVEELRNYLITNKDALQTRSKGAPVVVILDWDAKSKLNSFKSILDDIHRYQVFVMKEENANPELDSSFRGIERFYPTWVIEKGESIIGGAIAKKSNGQYCVVKDKTGEFKKEANNLINKECKTSDEYRYLVNFINEVNAYLSSVT